MGVLSATLPLRLRSKRSQRPQERRGFGTRGSPIQAAATYALARVKPIAWHQHSCGTPWPQRPIASVQVVRRKNRFHILFNTSILLHLFTNDITVVLTSLTCLWKCFLTRYALLPDVQLGIQLSYCLLDSVPRT